MQTTIPVEDLENLGMQLQGLLDDIPLRVRCRWNDERLIVIGQHQPDISLDARQTLRHLERKIQSLHLHFDQQVRLYLQVRGQRQPYACRDFKTQPPPPPPNPTFCSTPQPKEEWALPDEELDLLVKELLPATHHIHPHLPFVLKKPQPGAMFPVAATSALATLPKFHLLPEPIALLKSRMALTTGMVTVGLVGATYGLARPCVIGVCPELQMAESLNARSLQLVRTASSRQELESVQSNLGQAIATLETIPVWSYQSDNAQTLIQEYQAQIETIEQFIRAEDLAARALAKAEQSPHPAVVWQEVRSLWQQAIQTLRTIPDQAAFSPFIQRQLESYSNQLSLVDQQWSSEQMAQQSLKIAKDAIQLADLRERQAHSAEEWQLVKVTWQVVMLRLYEIPPNTTAEVEMERLLDAYQGKADQAHYRVEQAREAKQIMEQVNQQMQAAQLAEQRFQWQVATMAWNRAIQYARQIPANTAYTAQAQELQRVFQVSMAQSQQKVQTVGQVSNELSQICSSELPKCKLLTISDAIQVQLLPAYVEAIEVARNLGNRNLQAIVVDHQIALRHSLEALAHKFHRPVEVYDPAHTLLDRHLP